MVPSARTQLLDKLTQGDVTEASLMVVEGSTYAALKNALAANPDVNKTVLDLTDAELMRRIGAEGDHPEGWFFPDTYFYSSGSADLAFRPLGRECEPRHANGGRRLAAYHDQ